MKYTFKEHKLSKEEMVWLKEVFNNLGKEFDPKIAKVKLRNELPKGFDPKSIDKIFLSDGKILTLFSDVSKVY